MNIDNDVRLDEITPEDIRLYLLGHDWSQIEEVNEFLAVWGQHDFRRELFVPRTTRAADYETQLSVIVRFLSQHEDRSSSQILADMRHADADVIRLRIDTSLMDRGTINFQRAAEVLVGAERMLNAAARATISRQSYFQAPRPPAEVSDYLASTRLGQTEPGSFIFTLISPVTFSRRHERDAFHVVPPSDEPKAPFSRRVTETLAQSLEAIRGAAHVSERPLTNVFEDLVDDGVSANLCDALSEIAQQSHDNAVDLDFTWSAKGSTGKRRPHERIIVPPIITPALGAMSRHLKAVLPEVGYEVIGTVDRLLNQKDTDGFDLYLRSLFNGRERLVALRLTNEEREIASTAWRTGQSVYTRGTLDRRFRPYRLLEPTTFQVVTTER